MFLLHIKVLTKYNILLCAILIQCWCFLTLESLPYSQMQFLQSLFFFYFLCHIFHLLLPCNPGTPFCPLCWIGFPSTLILMLGTGFFLLITVDFVLIMFISMPYGLLFSLTAVSKACKNIGPSASKTVSPAYLRLLIFTPPIFTPFISSTSLNIFSVYRLYKFGDSAQPCRTPFFILNSDVIPLSVSILTLDEH